MQQHARTEHVCSAARATLPLGEAVTQKPRRFGTLEAVFAALDTQKKGARGLQLPDSVRKARRSVMFL